MPLTTTLALALVLVLASVSAQSLDAPVYSVGDTWTLREGNGTRQVTVVKVGDDGTTEMVGFLSRCPRCLVQLDRSLMVLAVLDGGLPADPAETGFVPVGGAWQVYSFPLEPRKRWEFLASALVRGAYEHYEVSNRVDRIEDVKTPAGTFRAYRIVRHVVLKGGQAMGRGRDVPWQTTTWFASDVKFPVKTTSTKQGAQDSELLSYELK
jgi:hypothetical protein